MSRGNDQLAVAVGEALKEGEIAVPDALIALAGTFEHPVQSLINPDTANELFDALDSEFGFMRISFIQNRPTPSAAIQPADQLRYAALLRWLIRELRAWRGADDPRQAKLVAAFVVAQRCDSGGGLWGLLPDEIGGNVDLLNHLERRASGRQREKIYGGAGGVLDSVGARTYLNRALQKDATRQSCTIGGADE